MKYIQYFLQSVEALLLAAALAFLLGNIAGIGHLHPHDPLLAIPIPVLFWIFGSMSLAIMWLYLLGQKASFKLMAILWFAVNLLVYQVGSYLYRGNLGPYLQDIAVAFAVPSSWVDALLQIMTAYLLLGSSISLFSLWYCQTPHMLKALAKFQKMSCPACGGHIRFVIQNIGQKIPCPHCQKTITLRKQENLKMSCFFCEGHIEFPPHALGQKMSCPHCEKDITLKEPA